MEPNKLSINLLVFPETPQYLSARAPRRAAQVWRERCVVRGLWTVALAVITVFAWIVAKAVITRTNGSAGTRLPGNGVPRVS
jgi:hypothetical protein